MSELLEIASVTIPEAAALKEKLLKLQEALQTASPSYESHLYTIHQALKNQPDFVHMLSDTQRSLIVRGLEKKTGIAIVTEKLRKPGSTKGLGLGDI